MKNFVLLASLILAAVCTPQAASAVTSPYVTVQTDVPLAQATDDTINGVLPYFHSHDMLEGTIESLTDATSPDSPAGNVILGPDNTWVGVAWDFGDPPPDFVWRLNRFDAWIAAGDDLRKGYQADLSVSVTGNPDDFTVISNSLHWAGLTQNDQYNHIRYDFPASFIAGSKPDMDRYPVVGFRYFRLNSRGDHINDVDWQTRFVEVDAWVAAIPDPAKVPGINSITPGAAGDVTLTWSAIPGRTYSIQCATNLLAQTEWVFAGAIAAESTSQSFTNSSAGAPRRFYRVMLQPVP